MFAGERYSKALDKYDNTTHHRAIRDILGFTLSETVIADIESLKTKYTRKLSELLKKNKETKNLGIELEKLQKYETQYKDLIDQSHIELKKQVGIKETNDERKECMSRKVNDFVNKEDLAAHNKMIEEERLHPAGP